MKMYKLVIVLFVVGLMAGLTYAQEAPKQTDPLGPGDHTRTLMMGEQKRTYLVHVPKKYDPKTPTPVVLALHGAAMDGSMMVWFSGLNKKSDEAGFVVVYSSGTGVGPFRTWNAGGFKGKMAEGKADDVAFIGKLLDDLATVAKVDEKRVYAQWYLLCRLSHFAGFAARDLRRTRGSTLLRGFP